VGNYSSSQQQWRKQIVWGLVLILVGAVFLLDRLGFLDIHDMWQYWPLLLVFVGLTRMIAAESPGEFTGGLWTVFIGGWLFAVFDDRFDFTLRNSWPLLLIGGGLIMVIKPFLEKRALEKKGQSHE